MKLLITGTSGRLGSALAHQLSSQHTIVGLDLTPGPYTTHGGSVTDRDLVFSLAPNTDAVLHTAALLTPHLHEHSRSAFVQTNIHNPQRVILRHFPTASQTFATLGWQFPTRIDRVYVIDKAEQELNYHPAYNFAEYLHAISQNQ